MSQLKAVSIAAMALALGGCSAASGLSQVSNAYSAARSGMTAKSAYSSVKDMRDAEPVFAGYTSVAVLADVSPRKDVPGFAETFRQNMVYLVRENSLAVQAPLTACVSVAPQACAGKVLVVQFHEEGYNANLVERYTMGDRLKGELLFTDFASGRLLQTKRIEGVSDYAGLMGLINGAIATNLLKSFPPASAVDARERNDAIGRVRPIQPGYEAAFRTS